MTLEAWAAVGAILVTLLTQTIIIARWTMRLQILVERNDAEINRIPGGLRHSRHTHANLLTQYGVRLDELERTIQQKESR